jgi:type II secretory pathway component PulF
MLLSRQLPLSSLIEFCRVLRHNLSAGLTLARVFRQQAERGPIPIRPVAARISEEIEQGESLEAALKREKDRFPPMFVSLATVGEQTGSLPEVLTELEKYFVLQQRLQRQFISQIAWPLVEFIATPFVIAAMIFFLAILSSGNKPYDPLGMGFTGVGGATRFLLTFWGTVGLFIALYFVVTRTFRQRELVSLVLLRLPVIGPTVSAIALTRFCLALRLTMEAGVSITAAVRLSMRATGNAAFAGRADEVRDYLKTGMDLEAALRKCGLFPENFLDILANAEEGGRVVEVMQHQAEYYEDEARRRMTILSRASSWGVYALVAALLVFMIFRIYGSYIGMIDSYTK